MNCHAELDPLESASLLSAAERVVRDETARAVDEKLLPLAAGAFEKGEMLFHTKILGGEVRHWIQDCLSVCYAVYRHEQAALIFKIQYLPSTLG